MNFEQQVIEVPLEMLHLWTENPRDPVDKNATDSDIIRRAIKNDSGNWNLPQLLSEMGRRYCYNELPTIVLIEDRYIVYDGNRRVALLKCIQNPEIFEVATNSFWMMDVPENLKNQKSLPCNLCSLDIALDIVERTHASSKKWGKLQFEQFRYYHRGYPKGPLMVIDEAGDGIVSREKKLNEECVETRLLTEKNLNDIGMSIKDGVLLSNHSVEESKSILKDIAETRSRNLTSYRTNPGRLKDALCELDHEKYDCIAPFDESGFVVRVAPSDVGVLDGAKGVRLRKKCACKHDFKLFNGVLRPKGVKSNNLYRAIDDMYLDYKKQPKKKNGYLPIIAFSIRLLLEVCAREYYASDSAVRHDESGALKSFLKEAKKSLRELPFEERNELSLQAEWLRGDYNFDGIIAKWAHGLLLANEGSVMRASIVAGDIIRSMWSD